MIQTPLLKVQRSTFSVIMFIVLYFYSFLYLTLYVFPDPTLCLCFRAFLLLDFILTTLFFLLSWLTDPGFISKSPSMDFLSIIPNFDPNNLCADCELIKPKRSRHCNICNRCVDRYDHHCPWINNCVGARNHAYFYLYILFLQLYMLLIFALIITDFRSKLQSHLALSLLRDYSVLTLILNAIKP